MRRTMTAVILTAMLTLTACGTAREDVGAPVQETSRLETTTVGETKTTTVEEEETATTEEAKTTTVEKASTTTVEETKTTTVEETTAEMNGAPNSDVVTIAGDWYAEDEPTYTFLHIEPDATFKAYHMSGVLVCEGIILYETETIEDTTVGWYQFYDSDDTFLMGMVDDGTSKKQDLYVGNGADPHYVRFGEGGLADDGRGPGEAFVGTWGCGRATLEITQVDDTMFEAHIFWSDSAAAHVEWDYLLTYEDGALVCNGGAAKRYVEYTSPDTDPTVTIEYTNGSGRFEMQGAGVIWYDLTEHSADDMLFIDALPTAEQ